MKKRFVLLFVGILLLLGLTACTERAPDGTPTYTVTFFVDGASYSVSVAEGELPLCPTTPEKASDDAFDYLFDGWDRPVEPASADATYIAMFRATAHKPVPEYRIYWLVEGIGYLETTCREGDLPTPPEMEECVVTDAAILTFTGWDPVFTPVTQDSYYYAQYDVERRGYTVNFVYDGTLVDTRTILYGEAISTDAVQPERDGYSFVGWGSGIVTGDMTVEPVFTRLDPVQLCVAQQYPLIDFCNGSIDTAPASALLYLTLQEHADPESSAIRDRILAHLRNLIAGGHEPSFDLAPSWGYPILAAGIALARRTPTVWNALTQDEVARLDCVMQSFAYMSAFGTDDDNNYLTGPGLQGNYSKGWNPNYRLANVLPIVFATSYFGSAEAVNDLLLNFDYDAHMARLEEYGFRNAYLCWSTPGVSLADGTVTPGARELLTNGGPAYIVSGGRKSAAGKGVGVRTTYSYLNNDLNHLTGIVDSLLSHCYGGGAVRSSMGYDSATNGPLAYIYGNLISPYEGQTGMMLEFAGSDAHGLRSSASYCTHDFIISVSAIAALDALGIYDLDHDPSLASRVAVGNGDLIFKLKAGYYSYSKGYGSLTQESSGGGYPIWKSWWENAAGDSAPPGE